MSRVEFVNLSGLDAECQEIIASADENGAPNSNLCRVLGHRPDILKGFFHIWKAAFEGGTLDHRLKELVRVKIPEIIPAATKGTSALPWQGRWGCKTSASSRRWPTLRMTSSLPGKGSPCVTAELMTRDHESVGEMLYAELRQEFLDGELVELGVLTAMCNGFDKLIFTWGLTPTVCDI